MTTIIFGETTDGSVGDSDSSYTNLNVDGGSLPSPTVDTNDSTEGLIRVDTGISFQTGQLFFAFDTSSVEVVNSASVFIEIDSTGILNAGTRTARMLAHDWYPSPLAAADYISSSNHSSYTTLAEVAISDNVAAQYYEFVFSDKSYVDKADITAVHLVDKDQSVTPNAGHTTNLLCTMAESFGTTNDPYIEIDETPHDVLTIVSPTIYQPPPRIVGY